MSDDLARMVAAIEETVDDFEKELGQVVEAVEGLTGLVDTAGRTTDSLFDVVQLFARRVAAVEDGVDGGAAVRDLHAMGLQALIKESFRHDAEGKRQMARLEALEADVTRLKLGVPPFAGLQKPIRGGLFDD